MRILAIAGSLRRESYNRRLLVEAMGVVPPGVRLQLWEGLRAVPPFDEDLEAEPTPAAVADLRNSIAAADAVLIATPEYNGSIPGVLKNALDWASRPYATNALRGKPVAVIGGSPGRGGAQRAQEDLRRVLGVIGADVIDSVPPVAPIHQRFDDQGALRDEPLRHRLGELVDRLTAHVAEAPVALAG
jgi:chromate reductase